MRRRPPVVTSTVTPWPDTALSRSDGDAGIVLAGNLVLVDLDHDAAGVDLLDHAATARVHRHARVARHGALDAGADQRLLRTQRRHGLALHVGAHQRAVGEIGRAPSELQSLMRISYAVCTSKKNSNK